MEYTTIYSYPKAWKLENKIYAICNFKFPAPIQLWQLVYFGITVACVAGLDKVLPPVRAIPWVIRYLIVPFFTANFLSKKKFDGKSPQRYFLSWISYMLHRFEYIERFRYYPIKQNKTPFRWFCVKGALRG